MKRVEKHPVVVILSCSAVVSMAACTFGTSRLMAQTALKIETVLTLPQETNGQTENITDTGWIDLCHGRIRSHPLENQEREGGEILHSGRYYGNLRRRLG